MQSSGQLRHDASALAETATGVREAIQHGGGSIERVAAIADYLASVEQNGEQADGIAKDAILIRNGDPETLDRWALWLRTIAQNAEKEAK